MAVVHDGFFFLKNRYHKFFRASKPFDLLEIHGICAMLFCYRYEQVSAGSWLSDKPQYIEETIKRIFVI
jgi:hypothetical protein